MRPGAWPARRAPRADLVLALLVIAVLAMMVVPLPTALIDLLIALNLGFGVLLVSAALYLHDALQLAAFPTLLLLGTLYRLALNVSSTRLILLQADAGRVIEAFGGFVVRGDYRVGALVFAMLTLIQFMVIARGAERVAEVGARFSLDALPGRQMAIEAELRAGTLRPDRARALRERLTRESQLYGALDGALKFVKGDAIAGIVITVVNFVGGVSLGVFARGLSLDASLRTYGLLTIGDGLVTQLPALLSATAAGLVVTRVAPSEASDSLAHEIAAQLFGEPRALALSALVLGGLALVPALPSWPFVGLALAAGLGAFARARAQYGHASRGGQPPSARPLRLELGRTLHAQLRTPAARAALTRAIADVRQRVADGLGVTLPEPEVVVAAHLAKMDFCWSWRELPERAQTLTARDDGSARIADALARLARQRAAEWLDFETVQRMVDHLANEQPALVRASIPTPLSLGRLAEVLRLLVSEGVSVRWLGEIVEAVAPGAARGEPAHLLVEAARRALARRITHTIAPRGALYVLRLSPMVEETLSDAVRPLEGEQVLALAPALGREIGEAVAAQHRAADRPHALVTQAGLRRHVRGLLQDVAPELAVLSPYELTSEVILTMGPPIGP